MQMSGTYEQLAHVFDLKMQYVTTFSDKKKYSSFYFNQKRKLMKNSREGTIVVDTIRKIYSSSNALLILFSFRFFFNDSISRATVDADVMNNDAAGSFMQK